MPSEVKELVEEIQKDFSEYKKANDERMKLVESGKAVPAELEAEIEKIETALADNEAQKERLEKIETAIKRGSFGGGSREDVLNEAKSDYSDLVCKYMRGGSGNEDHGRGWNETDRTRYNELHKQLGEAKLLAVQSDPDGGYWVSPDESGRMVERIFETSPMRQVASSQTISTDALEGIVDDDEAGAEWVGETDTPTDTTTPKIGKWRIPVHEQATRPKATNKLIEDSAINIETWLAGKVTRKFARAENLAFVSGDGVSKPRGFNDYPSNGLEDFERGKIGQLISASSGALDFDDLDKLLAGLKDEYEVNSTWAFNRRTKGEIRRLKDGDGQYLWEPSRQVGEPATILGRPIIGFEDMPNVAADAQAVAIADWTATYQIVDRIGISVLRDPFSEKPFVEFYTRKRVGGDVLNFDSIKILKIKA